MKLKKKFLKISANQKRILSFIKFGTFFLEVFIWRKHFSFFICKTDITFDVKEFWRSLTSRVHVIRKCFSILQNLPNLFYDKQFHFIWNIDFSLASFYRKHWNFFFLWSFEFCSLYLNPMPKVIKILHIYRYYFFGTFLYVHV